MDAEVAKEFAEMQRKMNNMQSQMDELYQILHKQNHDEIELNSGGITDIATILDNHDQAITEIGQIIGGQNNG